jgi:hypothetical protein
MVSLAIVLGGWIAVSLLLAPLIGRFLSVAGEGPGVEKPPPVLPKRTSSARIRSRHRLDKAVRRNAAIELDRREAGWPRAS